MTEIQGYLIVRDEVDIINEVLEYYQVLKRPLLVIDNGSTDGTELALKKWASNGAIELINYPTTDYDLKALLEMTVRMAVGRTDGWVLHIDADHFYDPPEGIDSLIGLATAAELEGANTVNFTEYCFHHTALDPDPEKEPSTQKRQRFYTRHISGLNQPRLFRAIPGVDVHSDGGHSIVYPDNAVIWFSKIGVLRHYPFRSFEQGRKKLVIRRQRYSSAGRARNWHKQYDHLSQDEWFISEPTLAKLHYWELGIPLK